MSKEIREKRVSRFYGIRAKERIRAAAVCLRSAATQLVEIRRRNESSRTWYARSTATSTLQR